MTMIMMMMMIMNLPEVMMPTDNPSKTRSSDQKVISNVMTSKGVDDRDDEDDVNATPVQAETPNYRNQEKVAYKSSFGFGYNGQQQQEYTTIR
mmetsp:Transcript_44941/g.50096  ORF Transcript_44941/g.50096 Transcript_44941/m.50096 type:complete len:93 (-) Transcript_44941:80-358(-)